ncbi:hypothetical protein K438DRAFT_1881014, partial [Mycena galopus ATCC 62051]
ARSWKTLSTESIYQPSLNAAFFSGGGRKRGMRSRWQMYVIFTAVVMFVLITMRCIIDTYRCVAAFDVVDAGFGIGAPNATIGLVTNAFWFFLTPIADAFMIFRTFHVWNRSYLIIITPTMLCVANLGSSIWVTIALAKLDTEGPAIWGNIVFKSLNLFLSLTLCTNIICTGLISFRILRIHRQLRWISSVSGPTYTMRVLSVIIESAAIYTLLLVGTLISNEASSYVNFVFFNCTPPTIGLVFSYIIIRVSRGTSYGENPATATVGTVHFRQGPLTTNYELDQTPSGPVGAVQVRLERETVADSDEPHIGKDSGNAMV